MLAPRTSTAKRFSSTLRISCEAVPASELGHRGHPAAPPGEAPRSGASVGADGSFVSCIALFGGAVRSQNSSLHTIPFVAAPTIGLNARRTLESARCQRSLGVTAMPTSPPATAKAAPVLTGTAGDQVFIVG